MNEAYKPAWIKRDYYVFNCISAFPEKSRRRANCRNQRISDGVFVVFY